MNSLPFRVNLGPTESYVPPCYTGSIGLDSLLKEFPLYLVYLETATYVMYDDYDHVAGLYVNIARFASLSTSFQRGNVTARSC